MPTLKQLFKTWQSQYHMFGGHGIPLQNSDEHSLALAQQRSTDQSEHLDYPTELNGRVIGRVVYDKSLDELDIIVEEHPQK